MKTKAAVINEPNADFSFEELELSEPKFGQILVKVVASGVCHTDEMGKRYEPHCQAIALPVVLGHEGAGIVEKVGPGVKSVVPGDHVVMTFPACGVCDNCRNGRESICEGGIKLMTLADEGNGGYAEYAKLPAKVCFPINDDVDRTIAALTEPLAVAVYDVRESGLQPGDTVLCSGGGVIGGIIACYCRYLGAKNVVVSATNANRRKWLESLGFKTVNPRDPDAEDQLKALNGGKLYDVTFECCGAQDSYKLCTNMTRRGGTFMFVGVTTEMRELYVRHILVYQLTVKGVNMYETKDFYKAYQIVNNHEMDEDLSKFVTDIFPLEQAYDGYMKAMSKDGSQVKILLDCEVKH